MNDAPRHSADTAPVERLHPFFILTGLGSSLRGIAGGYAGIAYLAATGRLELAVYGAIGILLVSAVGILLYWRRFSFRVGADEVRIDSGILSRTHRSIPFDRVQDVDITQGPVSRLLGLAKVKFETGAAAGSEEGVLPAIALDRAQALREYVRARRGVQVTQAQAEAAEPQPMFAMNLRRLLTAGVFNFSLAIFAGLFGVTQTFGDVLGFDPFERAFWESALQRAGPLADYVQTHRFGAAIAGLATLVLLGLTTGIIRTLLSDFRFRLDRTGTGLRRRRGLLTLTDVTLPLRRVQAALVYTGPIRDAFGWRELKLQSLAADEGNSSDHVVAPLAKDAEIDSILTELDWHMPTAEANWERFDRAYVWSFWLLLAPLVLAALVQMLFVPLAGVAFLSAVLAFALLRWLDWRRSGYTLGEDRLVVRTGWWSRRTALLPLRNIQSIDLSENAIGRRFGIASLTIGVAGGRGFSSHGIPALPRERARTLRDELLSRFA